MRSAIVAGLALLLLVAACTTAGVTPRTPPSQTPSEVPATGQTVEITLHATNFKFDPGVIRVNKGDRVIIHVTGDEGEHGFAIEGYGLSTPPIETGATQTLDFVAEKTGSFKFFCNVPCGPGHREMTGTLIVAA
jgi:heme/copper-type cytochrome/quinol oxidase subunit 2